MGRWAQRRTRGGGGVPTAAPALTPVTLIDVQSAGTDFICQFDGPITTDPAAVPDSGLTIDGFDVTSVSPAAGSTCSINTAGGAITPGLLWDLISQPGWLLTPIAAPSSGLTS